MATAPALAITRARISRAGPGTRARLEQVLAAATPAATGVPETALLLVRRLALAAPLPARGRARGMAISISTIPMMPNCCW